MDADMLIHPTVDKLRQVRCRALRMEAGAILYNAAAVCLLVIALITRFHGLSDHALSYDEAIAADNSRHTFAEVFEKTRYYNSSPILYPIALYAIQKVDSSAFSVRLLPATASVMTVAVLLFLLPRAGVGRATSFLAALMATLSVAAIRHAQGVREYGIDALFAALLIFALSRYTREDRKGLLCALLLIAPLMQYGLVLFGGAVLLAAWVAGLTATATAAGDRRVGGPPVQSLKSATMELLVPSIFFTAGCVASYGFTLREQLRAFKENELTEVIGWYQGSEGEAPSIQFALRRVWDLICYHLPGEPVAVFASAAFLATLLLMAARKVRARTVTNGEIPLLCVSVLVVMAVASYLELYPLGAIRQSVLLGPILFVAIGHAFERASALWGSDGTGGAVHLRIASLALIAGVVAVSGTNALVDTDPHADGRARAAVLATLDREVRDDDVVYISQGTGPIVRFYNEAKPANYHYGSFCTFGSAEGCIGELSDLPLSGTGRLWLVMIHNGGKPIHRQLEIWERQNVFRSSGEGDVRLYVSRTGLRTGELALPDTPLPAGSGL